jgi:hypothetical protein
MKPSGVSGDLRPFQYSRANGGTLGACTCGAAPCCAVRPLLESWKEDAERNVGASPWTTWTPESSPDSVHFGGGGGACLTIRHILTFRREARRRRSILRSSSP